LKRYSATAKINAAPASWVDFSYGLRFARTDSYRPTRFNGRRYAGQSGYNGMSWKKVHYLHPIGVLIYMQKKYLCRTTKYF
jgi:hypothetical protein